MKNVNICLNTFCIKKKRSDQTGQIAHWDGLPEEPCEAGGGSRLHRAFMTRQ